MRSPNYNVLDLIQFPMVKIMHSVSLETNGAPLIEKRLHSNYIPQNAKKRKGLN